MIVFAQPEFGFKYLIRDRVGYGKLIEHERQPIHRNSESLKTKSGKMQWMTNHERKA